MLNGSLRSRTKSQEMLMRTSVPAGALPMGSTGKDASSIAEVVTNRSLFLYFFKNKCIKRSLIWRDAATQSEADDNGGRHRRF
jgi:hypothetical protein